MNRQAQINGSTMTVATLYLVNFHKSYRDTQVLKLLELFGRGFKEPAELIGIGWLLAKHIEWTFRAVAFLFR